MHGEMVKFDYISCYCKIVIANRDIKVLFHSYLLYRACLLPSGPAIGTAYCPQGLSPELPTVLRACHRYCLLFSGLATGTAYCSQGLPPELTAAIRTGHRN